MAAVLSCGRLGRRGDPRRADRRWRRLPPLERRRRLTSHSTDHSTLPLCLESYERTLMALAITDETSPFALLSTRNRLRGAMRLGAASAWPWEGPCQSPRVECC